MPDDFIEKGIPFRREFQCFESEAMWEDIMTLTGYAKLLDFIKKAMNSVIFFLEIVLCSVDNIWRGDEVGVKMTSWGNTA